jgi:hypothetical protein
MSKRHANRAAKAIAGYLKKPARYLAPKPPRDTDVGAFLVTDAIPQDDGTTCWRLQYIPRATAAAMNADPRTRGSILDRREQPMYGPEQAGGGDRDYGLDDAMSEAAAARW